MRRLLLVVVIGSLLGVGALGCDATQPATQAASGSETTDEPTTAGRPTAEDLRERVVTWVEAEATRATMAGETGEAPSRYRLYGPDGTPVLYQTEPDAPFPGPILWDGSQYYVRVAQPGHEFEGSWFEVPPEVAETAGTRADLSDLYDTLVWFWGMDPLTALRAFEPVGAAEPGAEQDTWVITGALSPARMAEVIPLALEESFVDVLDDWHVRVTVTSAGEIRDMSVTMALDSDAAVPWEWSRAESAPGVPENAVDVREGLYEPSGG